MKKLFTSILALVASAGIAQAAIVDGSCGDNLTWSLNTEDSTLTITGSGAMTYWSESSYVPWSDYTSYIKYLSLSDDLTNIGENAFSNCSGLTSVTIPTSVTSIEDEAFSNCSGLTSVTIPSSVTSIGERAFSACSELTSVTIPTSVTSIGDRAFYDCSALISVTLKSNAIVSQAYPSHYSLKDIFGNQVKEYIIGESVTGIGDYAFYGCSGMTSVTIPNSITTIGKSAFSDCYILTSLNIPNSVTSIGDYAFTSCCNLTSLTIPNSVTSIGTYAFRGCSALTSVTIPNSVTNIGSLAFSECIHLISVVIPNSVTSIDGAFNECYDLTSVVIPNSVTSIGSSTFSDCTSLTSIEIPNSVTSIGSSAFRNCNSLTSVTIPNSVTSIGVYAFSSCDGLVSVTIGNRVTSIGDNAFAGCSGLTSVTIPNSVTSMGSYAFAYCHSLTSVTIPNSVTSIRPNAFSYCDGLTSVTNYATTPQLCFSSAFDNVDKSSCKLYVPIEAVSAYQSAAEWQDFPIGGAAVSSKADPDNTSAYYTTFFDSSNKYRLSAGMEAYTATINGDVLNLTKVAAGDEVIPANEAFILKSNAANLTMDVTEDDPVAVGANVLRGVDTATPSPANCYVLSGKSSDNSVQGLGFYQFSGTLGAHKAYLVLGGGASGAPRRLRFTFNETNTATGVEEVQGDKVQSTKVIENGQLYIMYKGTKYNVQGARVE